MATSTYKKTREKNHSLCYGFEVQKRKEVIERIIPFFSKNPSKIPSRKRDFELFKQIVGLLKNNPDLKKIENLKNQTHWGLAVYRKTVRAVGTQSSF